MSYLCLAQMLVIEVKLQSVYGVHKSQMPLPGRCVSVSILILNYTVTNVEPIQEDQPLFSSETPFSNKRYWNEQKFGHGSRNHERLCWRGPAAICWTWT
jgi:hypothetical protein